jgi:hypothetical protein
MFTSLPPLALLASALAAPVVDKSDVKNFYLLASPHKSTAAANATGLNLVDPYQQTNFLLRAQPTAASYSLFNLTSCVYPARVCVSRRVLTPAQEGFA